MTESNINTKRGQIKKEKTKKAMSSEIRTTRLCADLGKSLKNFMQYTFSIDASKIKFGKKPTQQ